MKGLLIILAAFLVSCEIKKEAVKPIDPYRIELTNESKYMDQNYRVYILESCEYIVVGSGNLKWGSHKGNCKNPIHKYASTSN